MNAAGDTVTNPGRGLRIVDSTPSLRHDHQHQLARVHTVPEIMTGQRLVNLVVFLSPNKSAPGLITSARIDQDHSDARVNRHEFTAVCRSPTGGGNPSDSAVSTRARLLVSASGQD